MIFTVGHTKSYESYFDTDPCPKKAKTGCAWQTKKEAQDYLNQVELFDYSVYGIEADWDNDTCIESDQSYRSLIVEAKLVKV